MENVYVITAVDVKFILQDNQIYENATIMRTQRCYSGVRVSIAMI